LFVKTVDSTLNVDPRTLKEGERWDYSGGPCGWENLARDSRLTRGWEPNKESSEVV